jgi:hypothetical protein
LLEIVSQHTDILATELNASSGFSETEQLGETYNLSPNLPLLPEVEAKIGLSIKLWGLHLFKLKSAPTVEFTMGITTVNLGQLASLVQLNRARPHQVVVPTDRVLETWADHQRKAH